MKYTILILGLVFFSCQSRKNTDANIIHVQDNQTDTTESVWPKDGLIIERGGYSISFVEIDTFSTLLIVPEFLELLFANINPEAKLSDVANVAKKIEKDFKIHNRGFEYKDYETIYDLLKNTSILKKPQFSRKDSSTIIISLANGSKKIINNANDSTGNFTYEYCYFHPGLNAHILSKKSEDGSEILIVNNLTGNESIIWNNIEHLTKDKKRFVTLATEQCSERPFGFCVYSISGDQISMDFQIDMDKNYNITHLNWKNNNTLELGIKNDTAESETEEKFQLTINKQR